jgi:hypothetical protein
MALVLKREQIQKAEPKYDLAPKPALPRELPTKDPVVAAIDRFSDALGKITKSNDDTQTTITALIAAMSSEIRAAQPARPKSWTFIAKKDKAGNMTINATPNY